MTGEVTLESTVVAVDDQISTTVEDEEVVLQLESGVYYGLDGVGTDIWARIQEPRTVAALIDEIVDSYEIERERVRADTIEFLTDLRAEDLIEVV